MCDAAHEGRPGPRDDVILTLLYDTGLRRGELSQVDREMLDLDEGELRIPAKIQKDYPNDSSPRPARFALDQSEQLRTVRTLRAYLNTKDGERTALFPNWKSDRMTRKGLNDVVKRAAERAAVELHAYAARKGCGRERSYAPSLRHVASLAQSFPRRPSQNLRFCSVPASPSDFLRCDQDATPQWTTYRPSGRRTIPSRSEVPQANTEETVFTTVTEPPARVCGGSPVRSGSAYQAEYKERRGVATRPAPVGETRCSLIVILASHSGIDRPTMGGRTGKQSH